MKHEWNKNIILTVNFKKIIFNFLNNNLINIKMKCNHLTKLKANLPVFMTCLAVAENNIQYSAGTKIERFFFFINGNRFTKYFTFLLSN